jgi:hypothetical protein
MFAYRGVGRDPTTERNHQMADHNTPRTAEAIATDLTVLLTAVSIYVEAGGFAEGDLRKASELARDLLALADPAAAERLTVQRDPRVRAAHVAFKAARERPENATVLASLIEAFTQSATAPLGEGEILRLEIWLDRTDPPLTAQRLCVGDVEDALELEDHEIREALDTRGFIDASDASQPMAVLWLVLADATESGEVSR